MMSYGPTDMQHWLLKTEFITVDCDMATICRHGERKNDREQSKYLYIGGGGLFAHQRRRRARFAAAGAFGANASPANRRWFVVLSLHPNIHSICTTHAHGRARQDGLCIQAKR